MPKVSFRPFPPPPPHPPWHMMMAGLEEDGERRVPHAHSVSSLVTISHGIHPKKSPPLQHATGMKFADSDYILLSAYTLETFFGPLIVAIIGAFGDFVW